MLLSVPRKVLNRVILDRLKTGVDAKLRDHQAGVRKDRSCTDQIATLRIIAEQSMEWDSSLYINFVDYEKAFDSLDRDTLWKLLQHYSWRTWTLQMTSVSSHTATNRCRKKTEQLNTVSIQLGLNINRSKTKIMKANTKNNNPITLNGEPLEETDSFTYLGSTINKNGGTEEDVKARIQKARVAFIMLRTIWRAKQIRINTKQKIFNSNVKAVPLYGSETWRTTHKILNRIQTFINKCLRKILHLKWTDKVPNTTLWKTTKQLPIENEIKKRKWRWIGHTLRKPPETITRQAITWNPPGKRRRCRPRNTWQRDTENDTKEMGYTRKEMEKMATDRKQWRSLVNGLCSERAKRLKYVK